jgi:hypothetical protein
MLKKRRILGRKTGLDHFDRVLTKASLFFRRAFRLAGEETVINDHFQKDDLSLSASGARIFYGILMPLTSQVRNFMLKRSVQWAIFELRS